MAEGFFQSLGSWITTRHRTDVKYCFYHANMILVLLLCSLTVWHKRNRRLTWPEVKAKSRPKDVTCLDHEVTNVHMTSGFHQQCLLLGNWYHSLSWPQPPSPTPHLNQRASVCTGQFLSPSPVKSVKSRLGSCSSDQEFIQKIFPHLFSICG